MPTARDLEQLWRNKSDDELLEAAGVLGEYTPDGQRVIREELKRRGFEDPVEQKGETALEATAPGPPPRECTRCRAEMRFLGSRAMPPGDWVAAGDAPELLEDGTSFDLYVCPECSHVDMFLNLPVDEGEGAGGGDNDD